MCVCNTNTLYFKCTCFILMKPNFTAAKIFQHEENIKFQGWSSWTWHSSCVTIPTFCSPLKVAYAELSLGFLNDSIQAVFLDKKTSKTFFQLYVVFILFDTIVLRSKSVNHKALTRFFSLLWITYLLFKVHIIAFN